MKWKWISLIIANCLIAIILYSTFVIYSLKTNQFGDPNADGLAYLAILLYYFPLTILLGLIKYFLTKKEGNALFYNTNYIIIGLMIALPVMIDGNLNQVTLWIGMIASITSGLIIILDTSRIIKRLRNF
jgi:hypothetical protein